MSEHVEAARRALSAFNDEGLEAALAHFDPEVEWIAPPEWVEEPVYYGREGLARLAQSWGESFDAYRLDFERGIDCGEYAVVLMFQRGRIKGSEDSTELRVGYHWQVRDGLTVRVRVFFSWEEALAAAGVSE